MGTKIIIIYLQRWNAKTHQDNMQQKINHLLIKEISCFKRN